MFSRSFSLTVKLCALLVLVVAGLTLLGLTRFSPGTAAGAATFTVDSTADAVDATPGDGTCATAGGACTLRAAIEEANALAGADTVAFNIPGAGSHTIQPTFPLPTITDPVMIDGYTQPGASANTNGPGLGTNAVLMVELDGSFAGTFVNGLTITAGSSTVKGLVINRFLGTGGDLVGRGNGIRLDTLGGNTIEGNYIGTDVTGTVDLGNENNAVLILDASNNTIGGTTAAARNVLSGNGTHGVRIRLRLGGASANVVQGNYIGSDVTGTVDLGNNNSGVIILFAPNSIVGGTTPAARNIISGNDGIGVIVLDATGTVVQGNYIGTDVMGTVALGNRQGVLITSDETVTILGGTAAGAGNLISGNGSFGVILTGNATGTVVQGNYIGTDVTGTVALGNGGIGVLLGGSASGYTIGGTAAGAGNVISGNRFGVFISGSNTSGTEVQGNYIGTDVTGTADLGNDNAGVIIFDASNNTIGGTASGAGNIIAFNGKDGVLVHGDTGSANAILSNSIFSNGVLGIDLSADDDINAFGDGVTPNDAGDGDIGGNNLQNYPVLTSAVSGSTNIAGSLNSTANTEFRLEFFTNTACDPSANGEGETFLGFDTVTTDGTGNVSYSVSFPTTVAVGQFITATATDPAGNTSEFSECAAVTVSDSDGDGVPDADDACPSEDSTDFDADNDGCIDSVQGLSSLTDALFAEGVIDSTMQNSVQAKIDVAAASATRDNVCAAVNQLDALKNQIEAQTGNKVSEDAAPELLQYIMNVQTFLLIGIAPETC